MNKIANLVEHVSVMHAILLTQGSLHVGDVAPRLAFRVKKEPLSSAG